MENNEQPTQPAADDEAPVGGAARPRPSWFLRWGKPTAMWLFGFGVGAAVVYGALWGKEEYDSYRELQALNLPEPPRDNETAKLFAPDTPPAVPAPPPVTTQLAEAPTPLAAAPAPEPPRVARGVKAKVNKATRPKGRLAATKVRKATINTRQSVRLADRRAAPRVLEIRRASPRGEPRPCRRGDLARECYVAR